MKPEIGKTYLITTDNWFVAPNGDSYKAVWGTVTAIQADSETLGLRTNRNSTNWYLVVGNMILAGCQIHYVIRCDHCSFEPLPRRIEHEGELYFAEERSGLIYNANGEVNDQPA